MAKKKVKKAPTKAAKKTPRKPALKASTPKPITTGRAPTPDEMGSAIVAHINAGRPGRAIWDKFWSRAVISVEGAGVSLAWSGRKAMKSKCAGWLSANTIHGCSAEGPYLGASGFSIKFRMDTQDKATGKRTLAEEIGVYTVQNGKIVREEFMYGSATTLSLPAQKQDPAPIGG